MVATTATNGVGAAHPVTTFLLNGQRMSVRVPPGLLALDWLRERRRLTGTKEGCKEGDCGACSVLVGRLDDAGERVSYEPVTSCLLPVGELRGKHLLTIEGLNLPPGQLNPVQDAMVAEGGSQCGYCTPGFIVAMTWYVMQGTSTPSRAGMEHAISGNLCRCTGYGSIWRATDRLVADFGEGGRFHDVWTAEDRVAALSAHGLLPAYLTDVTAALRDLDHDTDEANGHRRGADGDLPRFVIAGGTDLYVQQGEHIPHSDVEVLAHRPELDFLDVDGDGHVDFVTVGPLTSFEDFANEPRIQAMLPTIKADMDLIASLPIRNRATIAGNLVNASPIGDMTAVMLALGTQVTLTDRDGSTRSMPLEAMYLGYKTLDKRPGELITELRFPAMDPGDHYSFEKVSKRRWLDIATVNSAARLTVEDDGVGGQRVTAARLTLGGVAATPLYLPKASAALVGQPLSAASVRQALAVADTEIAPISDVRGSAAYKRLLGRQLLAAHFVKLFPGRIALADVFGGSFVAAPGTQEVQA